MGGQSAGGHQHIDLIGAPFNSSGMTDGVARAPRALRHAGVREALVAAGFRVEDQGDVALASASPTRDPNTRVIASAALAPMIRSVRRAVTGSLEANAFPIVLGGDCPVLLGCVAASATHLAPRLLFVDGHEDAWPAALSTTGEAADMELGWLLGCAVDDLPPDLRREIAILDPDDVIAFGPRDEEELGDAGVDSIGDLVPIVRPQQIVDDPGAAVDWAISTLSARGRWWLHVDLDVLSTESLAAVDYPQAGGLEWPVLTEVTRRALASPDVLGWTVTIYNPDLDPDGVAAAQIVHYLAESLKAA
jgi:arginase